MKKRNIGQLILAVAIIMILANGVVMWFDLLDKQISSVIFVIALILVGAGAYISKSKG